MIWINIKQGCEANLELYIYIRYVILSLFFYLQSLYQKNGILKTFFFFKN